MQGALCFSGGSSVKFSPETFRLDRRRAVISAAFVEVPVRTSNARRAETLYEVLKVRRDASVGEIKCAYRSLAKLYHPDVSAAAEAEVIDGKEFIEIHDAYKTLSDQDARAEYDVALGRRRPIMRYREEGDSVRAQGGYYSGRRWETDQCW